MFNKELLSFLQTAKLFVATPMYGGMCHGSYTRSIAELFALCTRYQITVNLFSIDNESLIQRGRNSCAREFLESGFSHLLFIDADIGFRAQDALHMLSLSLQDKNNCFSVLTAPYPKKKIAWNHIKQAVEKGLGNQNPNDLAKFLGDYAFQTLQAGTFSTNTPLEIFEAGTGFMMIPRETLELFQKAYPDKTYQIDDNKTTHAFFDCLIDPKTKRYLAEDSSFCHHVREMGGHIWLLPWIRLSHSGNYLFEGSLSDLSPLYSP